MEHQTLGQWVVRPINPATQRIILKIVGFCGAYCSAQPANKPVKTSLAKQPTNLTVQLYRLWAVACETYDPNAFSPCLLPQDSIPAYHQLYLFSCGIYGAIIQISRELRIFCKCLRDWSFILWPWWIRSFLANWQNLAKEP